MRSARRRASSSSTCSIFAAGVPSSGEKGNTPTPLYARLAQEFAQLLEFRLALAGQTRDKACTQDKAGDALAQSFEQLSYLVAGPTAVHTLENGVVDVLYRNVEILGRPCRSRPARR